MGTKDWVKWHTHYRDRVLVTGTFFAVDHSCHLTQKFTEFCRTCALQFSGNFAEIEEKR